MIGKRSATGLVATLVLALAAGLGWLLLRPEQTPAEGSAEVGFARDMQVHHAQAVEMAFIIRDRTDDPTIRTIAYDIATGQQQQMGQMFAWLQLWDLPQASTDEPMAWMSSNHEGMPGMSGGSMLMPDGRMPGMASSQDLDRLRTLRGKAAEIAFLRLMIVHHRGGVAMARAAIADAEVPQVAVLAKAIASAQTAEIAAMTDLLEQRGAPR